MQITSIKRIFLYNMIKALFGFFVLTLFAACGPEKMTTDEWIKTEIQKVLADSTNPVVQLHIEGGTERNWYYTETVKIGASECQKYQIDLVTRRNGEIPSWTVASSVVAFDTLTRTVFRVDNETGEFVKVK